MQLFQQRLPCLAPQLSQAAGRLHQIVRPRMRPAEHHCWASGISAPERPVLCLPLFSSSTPDFAPPPPPVHATPPAATPPAATAAEQTGSRGMIPTAGKRLTIAVAQVLGVLSGFAVLVTLCIQAPRAFHTIMASLFKAMGISTTGNGEIGSALEAIGLLGTVLACIVSAVYQVAAAWESLQDGIEQVQQQQQGLKEELKDLLRQQEARQQQQLQQQLQQQDARQEQQMQQQQLKLQLDTVRDQLRQQEARQQQQLQQQETWQEQQQMKLQEQETRQEQRQMKLQLDSVSAKLSSMDQNGSRRWF